MVHVVFQPGQKWYFSCTQKPTGNFSSRRLNQWLPVFYMVWCITRFASKQFKASSDHINMRTSSRWAIRLSVLFPGNILHTLHIPDCNKFSDMTQATVWRNTASRQDAVGYAPANSPGMLVWSLFQEEKKRYTAIENDDVEVTLV